jgi:hypothetical protein
VKTLRDIAAVAALLTIGFLLGPATWAQQQQQPATPIAVWGVRGCGVEVYWMVDTAGEVRRYDAEHKPNVSHEVFLAWLEQAPAKDIVELNVKGCTST